MINNKWKNKDLDERFWEKVVKDSPNKCWIWQGYKNPKGYGMFCYNKRPELAHRWIWKRINQECLPDNVHVLHKCDNPSCVNPSHLRKGTAQDNSTDMKRKGRSAVGDKNGARKMPHRVPKGTAHCHVRLNEQKVKQLRRDYAQGSYSQQKLAELYGVARTTVQQIIERRTWKHVL